MSGEVEKKFGDDSPREAFPNEFIDIFPHELEDQHDHRQHKGEDPRADKGADDIAVLSFH